MTSIIIVDDHPVISRGLKGILEKDTSFEIVGEAADSKSALSFVEKTQPHIVILDITLQKADGISLIARIKEISPGTEIIMYTMHNAKEYVYRAFQLGALGYVLKGDTIEEIRKAVNTVVQKRPYFSSGLPGSIAHELLSGKSRSADALSDLTPREYEVASCIARGMTPDQVAAALFISPKTVRVHRTNLMHKLSCNGVQALLLQLHKYFPS